MSFFPSELLLYPQTFLFPDKAKLILSQVSKLILLKLPKTREILEKVYKDLDFPWKEKIFFLEFKSDLSIDWDRILKEVISIEEWGLNFRTPENLKYFSHFREVVEDTLEEIFPTLKEKKRYVEQVEIRRALIVLILAERLDYSLYELDKSLKDIEQQLDQIFEEKIIGEDYTFEKSLETEFEEILKISFSQEELPNLSLRISSWKILGKYINWNEWKSLNSLLITEKDIIEDWKEKFSFEKEKTPIENFEIYNFKNSIFDLLGFSEKNSLNISSETRVILLNKN